MSRSIYTGSESGDTGELFGGIFNNMNAARGPDRLSIRQFARILLAFAIVAAVIVEGYYIFFLRGRINRQTEDLKNISLQLQALKNEKSGLSRELSSIKRTTTGDEKNGNAADR